MEGKREHDDADDGVEQYREFVVEGELYQALDLARRLLQLDGLRTRRAEAALLLLDRLRSNRDDSADHANALLRVLANYAAPTKELTEELLSLLFFCDHRVHIIHHLSKLTYDSSECIRLVLNAYIELLSSDRSLLVPILGSLADLPLTPADKAIVIDATEGLLDAASEEDVPAVVQSLLSMLVPAAASRIVAKIRSQCNRLRGKPTLTLTFNVIARHAVAGSRALTAFLRVIRNVDVLMPFDLILLALLTARPSENSMAVRATAAIAAKTGALSRNLVHETIQSLRDQRWNESFSSFVGLSSSLLSACFNTYRTSTTMNTIQCAVDTLGYLVGLRTPAQEEALSLLMTLVSQPQRLVLSTKSTFLLATAHVLCWDVARCVADQLADVATGHVAALAPFAHIFLDHLYGIAISSSQSYYNGGGDYVQPTYPAPVLESLCRTMVMLVKHELGLVSLLMIMIQKQLVVPVGRVALGMISVAPTQASDVAQVKQLMAVFLAGEMLRQGVGEQSDRSSLFSWIQKLLASTAVSDETTTHIVRLLGSSSIRATLSKSDVEASSTLLSSVFRQHGFDVREHREVTSHRPNQSSNDFEVLPGLSGQSDAWVSTSMVFDVVSFVRVARLGQPSFGWHSLVSQGPSGSAYKIVERSIRAKIALLQADVNAFMATITNGTRLDRALICSFALPSVTEDTFALRVLPGVLWCYACALEVAVITTNSLVLNQGSESNVKAGIRSTSDALRLRRRLLNRVQTCWLLHRRLVALLDEARTRLKQAKTEDIDPEPDCSKWLQLQVDVIGQHAGKVGTIISQPQFADLSSLGSRLSLQVVSAIFGGLWKQQALTVESGLEIELFGSFPAHLRAQAANEASNRADVDPVFVTMEALINTQDGKRSIKYLSRRLLEYAERLASLSGELEDSESDDNDSNMASERHWILIGTNMLCSAIQSIIEVCRKRRQHSFSGDSVSIGGWEMTAMELLSKGAFEGRIRVATGAHADMWFTYCEILFRSLAQATVQAKDEDIGCKIMGILHALMGGTRMGDHLSRLCFAMLHCAFSGSSTSGGKLKQVEKFPTDLASSDKLRNWIRPQPRKFHHLVYFITGSWLGASGIKHHLYALECMDELISAAAPSTQPGKSLRLNAHRDRTKGVQAELSEEDDLAGWIARDGEHRIFKSLTNESLPVLLESVISCIAASPLPDLSSSIARDHRKLNPFIDLMGAIATLGKSLDLFVTAESSGYTFPQRTSTAVLRCGPIATKKLEDAVEACLTWRQDGEMASVGGIDDLQSLLEASLGLHSSMERIVTSFQERVLLTVQNNTARSSAREGKGMKPSKSRRWGSELLSKTFGNQLQRRKALTRSEVKLLPYFSQSTEHLKAFIAETSGTYHFDIKDEHVRETMACVLETFRMTAADMEAVMRLLDAKIYAVDADLLANGVSLKDRWSEVRDLTKSSLDVGDMGDESNDTNSSDGESSDEFDDADAMNARFPEEESKTLTKRSSSKVHTLTPQKKRPKSAHLTNR